MDTSQTKVLPEPLILKGTPHVINVHRSITERRVQKKGPTTHTRKKNFLSPYVHIGVKRLRKWWEKVCRVSTRVSRSREGAGGEGKKESLF